MNTESMFSVILLLAIVVTGLAMFSTGGLVYILKQVFNNRELMTNAENAFDRAPSETQDLINLLADALAMGERLATSVVPSGSPISVALGTTGDILTEITDDVPLKVKLSKALADDLPEGVNDFTMIEPTKPPVIDPETGLPPNFKS